MHELGLCQSIVMAVEGKANGRRVTGVGIRIGSRHGVDRGAFDQAFAMVAQGTVADGADFDLVVVPTRVTCRSCGDENDSTDQLALCPACGSADVAAEGGDALVLEWLAFEADPPVVASP